MKNGLLVMSLEIEKVVAAIKADRYYFGEQRDENSFFMPDEECTPELVHDIHEFFSSKGIVVTIIVKKQ